MRRTFIVLSIFCSAWAAAQHTTYIEGAGAVPHYLVQRAHAPIAIDGHIDEHAWESAEQINQFERILNNYDNILFPTRAKMLWDDQYFYFAFSCVDDDMWTIYTEEDDHIWEEEVVEVFIDPDGDGKNYLEVEVSPTNTVVDLAIYSVEPEWVSSVEWDIKGLKSAVQVYGTVNDASDRDRGWSVEIAIPWAAMADTITGGSRPTAGDTWRLNLYRIERKAGRAAKAEINALTERAAPLRKSIAAIWQEHGLEVGQEEKLDAEARRTLDELNKKLAPIASELSAASKHFGEQTEYGAWSETFQRGFHHPARFGAVRFAD